jgi:hypothetical protein
MTELAMVQLPGGMRIGSGGTAFFDGIGWTMFRDCQFIGNTPDAQAACYFDRAFDQYQCFTSERIE